MCQCVMVPGPEPGPPCGQRDRDGAAGALLMWRILPFSIAVSTYKLMLCG